MSKNNVMIKRIYEEAGPGDGMRVLVDRLWPRGIKKEVESTPGEKCLDGEQFFAAPVMVMRAGMQDMAGVEATGKRRWDRDSVHRDDHKAIALILGRVRIYV
jgi:hypothetical protein